MRFYSGFSLKNESYLFDRYMKKSDYTICGFSYGAIKALKYLKDELACGNRVDTLQLFSPVFFQTKDEKFKRLQIMAYKKDKDGYLRNFLSSCFEPYEPKIVENVETTVKQLEELLNYEWDKDELEELVNQGVKIEVYLGGKDKIIDEDGARSFFRQVATVTYIKAANHFLQIN
jgi:hypothetical protein